VTAATAPVRWPAAVVAPGPVSHVFGDGCLADEQAARLARLIDPAFLAEAGWDPGGRVLTPPCGHPQLGWLSRRDGAEVPAGGWPG
jgi:hypothetical protein